MKLLNEMLCLLKLEGSHLTFLLSLVTVNDDILSDVVSYLYSHLHSALGKLLWLKFLFLHNLLNSSIMQEVSPFTYKQMFLRPHH